MQRRLQSGRDRWRDDNATSQPCHSRNKQLSFSNW